MRKHNGLTVIYNAIEKLRLKHTEHMTVYGKDNEKRMSGEYETANYNYFSFNKDRSVDRGASIRVGHDTIKDRKGYFEDRRPASNMDPYLVTSKIFETTCM
jgi:glutamine synthetase